MWLACPAISPFRVRTNAETPPRVADLFQLQFKATSS
jgi:hypothetical protein